jgi:bla regulator protein blaR1
VVSPMLWSVGGRPRILFPSELLSRLDDCAVATLLTHELAHYRRGDHRVRLLEFLASGLFWWHPIVWVARRELEISEEQCCDAWVVDQFPASQRRYADALLATVDFLSEDHPPLPAMASGLGDVPLLRQRLKMIMCGTAPKSLSVVGRLIVVLTAMLIPISPSLRGRTQAVPAAIDAAPTSVTPEIQARNLDVVQARAAQLKRDIELLSKTVQASRGTRNGLKSPLLHCRWRFPIATPLIVHGGQIVLGGKRPQ